MKKIYYEKQGRRYVPVREYDGDMMYALPKGNHLIMCDPEGSSYSYNIDPAYAPMIAAGRVAEDAICKAIVQAQECRPSRTPMTPQQQRLWKELAESFRQDDYLILVPGARDAAEAGVKALAAEAEKLLANPSVRAAYDHFLLVCELAKKDNQIG